MKRAPLLLSIVLAASTSACGFLSMGSAQPAIAPEHQQTWEDIEIQRGLAAGEPWAEQRWLANTMPLLDECEAQAAKADGSLGKALEQAAGGGDATSMGSLVASLRRAGSSASIETGASGGLPVLELAAKGAGVSVDKLRDDVAAINATNQSSYQTMSTCILHAKKLTDTFAGLYNSGVDPTPQMFAIYARFLRAASRGEHAVATSVSVVAALEGAFAGKDPKVVDAVIDGARKAHATPVEVTDAQAKRAFEIAADELVKASLAQLDKTCAEHPEWTDEKAIAKWHEEHPDAPHLPNPCDKKTPNRLALHRRADQHDAPNDGSAASLAAYEGKSDTSSDGDLSADTIRKLVPDDSPAAHAMDAFNAIKNGDAKGAIKSALELVPIAGPLGSAIGGVLSLL
jgi:hypothetical protein